MIPPPKATSTFTFDAETPNTRPTWYGAGGDSRPPAPRDSDLCFEDEVQRRLGGSPEAREPCLLEHVSEPSLAGLGAESESDLLRQGVGRADRRGSRVQQRGHRIVREVGGTVVQGE